MQSLYVFCRVVRLVADWGVGGAAARRAGGFQELQD